MGKNSPFQLEAWTEYGIGVLVIFLRIFARWKVVGIQGWKGDDYFIILALVFYTAELCMLEFIGRNGTNIGWTDEQRANFTPDEISSLEKGSKFLLAGWIFYSTLIWCLKACMLYFYSRLTLGLWQQKVVKMNIYACIGTYIAVMLTIFCHCRPIRLNWQVSPDPGDRCTLGVANYLVIGTTNLVTDAILLTIPVPLLMIVKISIRRKLVIGLLLGSGLFVMIATLLRMILSLRSAHGINISTIWAIRETTVAVLVVNAPAIKPLFSSSHWVKSSSNNSAKHPKGARYEYGSHELSAGKWSASGEDSTTFADSASQEYIVQDSEETHVQDRTPLEIQTSVSYEVSTSHDGVDAEERGLRKETFGRERYSSGPGVSREGKWPQHSTNICGGK